MSGEQHISDQLLRAAKAALEADGMPTVRLRALPDKEQGVAVRLLPWVQTRAYMDGQRDYAIPLEAFCRMRDQGQAMALASRALEVLSHRAPFGDVDSCDVTDVSPYTGPTEWPNEPYGLHAYVVGVRCLVTTYHDDFED